MRPSMAVFLVDGGLLGGWRSSWYLLLKPQRRRQGSLLFLTEPFLAWCVEVAGGKQMSTTLRQRRQTYENRSDCSPDRKCAADVLRRYRARRFLFDGGARQARSPDHALCQRRLLDLC